MFVCYFAALGLRVNHLKKNSRAAVELPSFTTYFKLA